jgi:nucleotide-binding universal stress UspA family protein
MQYSTSYSDAVNDFRASRNQAFLKEILSRFTGKSAELLSYEDVRQKLKLQGGTDRGLKEIPLDAIVGSVGRYTDFTRDFLPRKNAIEERWARVRLATEDLVGLPPIDVYQIGEVYFVLDGNHRVSVARRLGAKNIQAYVTEVRTRVPITPDIHPDELIIKAEYADFLEKTHLDELRPVAELNISIPGQYDILLGQIAVHRYFMGVDLSRDISDSEAVTNWYDTVYMPIVEDIRSRGILHDFPDRTETDLYLWIGEHRAALEEQLGWTIPTESSVSTVIATITSQPGDPFTRLGGKILDTVTQGKLVSGPPIGQWRAEAASRPASQGLFSDILVALDGTEAGWHALEAAILIAQRESARVRGLHIVSTDEEKVSALAESIQSGFDQRCDQAGIQGQLAFAVGEVARTINDRARFSDLVITSVSHPTGPRPSDRIESGLHDLLQRCPRPVMTIPGPISTLQSALLAYNGSPKSEEALFLATYLAGHWQIPLNVITVFGDEHVQPETLLRAQVYLEEHGIQASYFAEEGTAAKRILARVKATQSELVILGGFGHTPLLEFMLGSVVDQVLRQLRQPCLICR